MSFDMYELADKIVEFYRARGVPILIKEKDISVYGDRCRFKIKVRKGTRVELVRRYACDAKFYLKLPLFQVEEEDTTIYIVVSKKLSRDNQLMQIWGTEIYAGARKTMGIAHPIGFDILGSPVIADLTKYPHAIVSGNTRSGKSVALKCLLTSVAAAYSPEKLNILIGDRASDLLQFSRLPHLVHPIVEECDTFFKTMLILRQEMNRRISIKRTEEFARLPSIICVVDEFNSFISGITDKKRSKIAVDTISEILRMGRHARIHMVLASHNPTKGNMKINTSDLPTKLVFRVSKPCNSVVALGEGGAEKLRGEGDMLFSQNGEIQRLQGAFISSEEIDFILRRMQDIYFRSPKQWRGRSIKGKYGFTITKADLQKAEEEFEDTQEEIFALTETDCKSTINHRQSLFAKVILWTLGKESISCNMLSETFNLGWRRANGFIKQLYDMEIVGDLDAKLPRRVLLQFIEEVPERVMEFMLSSGISMEQITSVMNAKKNISERGNTR